MIYLHHSGSASSWITDCRLQHLERAMNPLTKLLEFLERLDKEHIAFTLKYARADTMMVLVCVPGEYWEVEFFEDGHVEVEVYHTRAGVESEEALTELFELHGDRTPPD
jgi:hypothetical protein